MKAIATKPPPSPSSLEDELSRLPAVDRLLNEPEVARAADAHGRAIVLHAVREVIDECRARIARESASAPDAALLAREVAERVRRWMLPSPQRVFNLSGTVLHTNLGRAPLPQEAMGAILEAAGASSVEFDLEAGKRGERDASVEKTLRRLIGAESAVIVNNNAAAVLLVLNTLASGKEVPVSRGELVEIGGSFRMPDIMRRAGCRLREVGTTNRTHARDYEEAIGPKTGLVMKVRTSNYEVKGFTSSVSDRELAAIARKHGRALFVDLGSGSLLDLEQFGLPHEPTPQEALRDGADLVSFSGDKLLGGPQAGVIVGSRELIAKIRRNPLLRALRIDKLRLAALSAVLKLYSRPEQLAEKVPALRLLARNAADIEALASEIRPLVQAQLAGSATVEVVKCQSQVGSGAHPLDQLESAGLRIAPAATKRQGAAALELARKFRALPIPVVGRIHDQALLLDFRCLEAADRAAFVGQLPSLDTEENRPRRAAWTSNPMDRKVYPRLAARRRTICPCFRSSAPA